ncbi:RMD1 [Ecytonucleospora hepatopenaei]|uniref:RMD1 n=1 Tax=Ecytonucleospora hepatopenaei TaxID=646526 RepID=A0A1W0E575_9MICR|nr:RMD1 [Ecytonucleospora hepatopenaei]
MSQFQNNTQRIKLSDLESTSATGRKASRIELRLLRDAYNLSTNDAPKNNEKSLPSTDLKRCTAYCTADSYDLKKLYKLFKSNEKCQKVQMFFGECLYAKIDDSDIFFLEYGVVVTWGLEEKNEHILLKLVKNSENHSYDFKTVEVESFEYGIASDSQIVNDKIFIKEDYYITKMVISTAIAQSVKLDYFEELVDVTIDLVKDFPEEYEKEGNIGKTRKDLFQIMGKLHKLSFNLNLASNILDEPELIWHFDAYSPMYETCLKYLDIVSRADILNKRCEIIHGILEILSTNITTHNSETLEKRMTLILAVSAGFGFCQCILLVLLVIKLWK